MTVKTVSILNLQDEIELCERKAQFARPFDETLALGLIKVGLGEARLFACAGMGWIWRQWLAGGSKAGISRRIEPLVERGLEMRQRMQWYDYQLTLHDILLLCCAIFASSESQLQKVATQVADANGDKGKTPFNNGELYASAWSGMLKHWILGNHDLARQQSELIWGAYRDVEVRGARKPLVTPWLKRDWKAFVKCQQKDFEKRWASARKDAWTIKSETEQRVVVTTSKYQLEHQWCWGHCAMAMLAHRQGIEVATDPLWFPPHAVIKETSDQQPSHPTNSNEQQQDLF